MDGTLAFLRIKLGIHFPSSINLISLKGMLFDSHSFDSSFLTAYTHETISEERAADLRH